MKLACCSWSYHRSLERKRLTFDGWLRLCAHQLGVGGVDLIAEQVPARTRRRWLTVKKTCTDLGLTIVSLSPSNNFGLPAHRARQAELGKLRRWLDVAALLGAPIMRIFAGWPPAGQARTLWPAMVRCVQAVGRSAAQVGVTVAVEPHNHGGFVSNSTQALRLIKDVDSSWVRLNLDTGNYEQPDVYAGLAASLPYAPHVVAKVHHLDWQGRETTLDYERIFSLLKRQRYRGFVTLEYEGSADERAAVPRAIAMLRRLGAAHDL